MIRKEDSVDYISISVPDMNDSFSRVVLGRTSYQMRFTWNDTAGRWMWGIYTADRTPIVEGVRIVPSLPLNLFVGRPGLPAGAFGVITELEAVRRRDFIEGNAQFVFIPAQDTKK